jgi:membrane protease YdiL (CAAX protease family)
MDINESIAVFAIAAAVILSFIYFLILKKMKPGFKDPVRINMIYGYIMQKTSGLLLLGGIPAILAWILFEKNTVAPVLTLDNSIVLWPWIASFSALIILLNGFNSKNPGLQAMYPELRLKEWRLAGITLDAGGWILYLSGYEYLFRGLLLFSCFNAFGLWPAVVINLALYSTLHLPKGIKEAIAAVPFGAVLCYLTLESNSILPAILLHSVQAISCDLFCIWRNPGMRFDFTKSNKP